MILFHGPRARVWQHPPLSRQLESPQPLTPPRHGSPSPTVETTPDRNLPPTPRTSHSDEASLLRQYQRIALIVSSRRAVNPTRGGGYTAALILLRSIHYTRLRNTRPPSFSGSRHLNATPCTCDLGCRHRAAVVSVAAARLNSQARRDSDETQDNAPAACHKNKPLVACAPQILRVTRDARGHAYLSETTRIL